MKTVDHRVTPQIMRPEWCHPAELEIRPNYIPIVHLGINVRTYNALSMGGVHSVRQLIECSEEKLATFYGLGKRSLENVKERLAAHMLHLDMTVEDYLRIETHLSDNMMGGK